MLALLRGSRTTLPKYLAEMRPFTGRLNSNLLVNGFPAGASFSRLIGYVEKIDAHQPYLYVHESLQFNAALHLGKAVNPMSCHIHVELAAKPSILFLEKAVSGLETRGTLTILNILSQVNSGQVRMK